MSVKVQISTCTHVGPFYEENELFRAELVIAVSLSTATTVTIATTATTVTTTTAATTATAVIAPTIVGFRTTTVPHFVILVLLLS